MSEQVIKLSINAAERIKEIMSRAEDKAIGVRVGVKSGGCAGMSYVMEYAKDIKPNEEIVEDKWIFVIARPPGGGMPYAVARRPASLIPLSVVLDDFVAMTANRKLSSASSFEIAVFFSAASTSGQAS